MIIYDQTQDNIESDTRIGGFFRKCKLSSRCKIIVATTCIAVVFLTAIVWLNRKSWNILPNIDFPFEESNESFSVTFKDEEPKPQSCGEITIDKGGKSVTFRLDSSYDKCYQSGEEENNVKGILTSNRIDENKPEILSATSEESDYIVENRDNSIRIEYAVLENAVKEKIIFLQKPSVENTKISLNMELSGLMHRKRYNGLLYFYDENNPEGKPLFRIPQPYMVDANGDRSENIQIHYILRNEKEYLEIEPDVEWLFDENRQYPVEIDPTIEDYQDEREIVSKRTVHQKVHKKNVANNVYTIFQDYIHYPDSKGDLQEIDTIIRLSSDPAYKYEMTRSIYKVKVKEFFTDPNFIQVEYDDSTSYIITRPSGLIWEDSLGKKIAELKPYRVPAHILDSSLIFENAYGQGIDFIIELDNAKFNKWIRISDFSALGDTSTFDPDEEYSLSLPFELAFDDPNTQIKQGEKNLSQLAGTYGVMRGCPDCSASSLEINTGDSSYLITAPYIKDSAEEISSPNESSFINWDINLSERDSGVYPMTFKVSQQSIKDKTFPVYISADDTYYGPGGDGYIFGSSTNYNTARSTSSGCNIYSSNIIVGVRQLPNWIFYRGFLRFDTTAIPWSATITDADLRLTAYTNYTYEVNANLYVDNAFWEYPLCTYRESNYDFALNNNNDILWKTISNKGWTANTAYTEDINTSFIRKGQLTYLTLIESCDHFGICMDYVMVQAYQSYHPETTYDPALIITTGAPNGTSCESGEECASGYCVDHYCCNSACNAKCQACDTVEAQGTCVTFSEGTDPDNECNPGAYSCDGTCRLKRFPGTCDGDSTNCEDEDYEYSNCSSGTSCSSGTCSSSYYCSTTNHCSGGKYYTGKKCNGSNSCSVSSGLIGTDNDQDNYDNECESCDDDPTQTASPCSPVWHGLVPIPEDTSERIELYAEGDPWVPDSGDFSEKSTDSFEGSYSTHNRGSWVRFNVGDYASATYPHIVLAYKVDVGETACIMVYNGSWYEIADTATTCSTYSHSANYLPLQNDGHWHIADIDISDRTGTIAWVISGGTGDIYIDNMYATKNRFFTSGGTANVSQWLYLNCYDDDTATLERSLALINYQGDQSAYRRGYPRWYSASGYDEVRSTYGHEYGDLSDLSCSSLGWTNAATYGDSTVCGESDASPLGACSGLKTWADADAFCQDAGARLCSLGEVNADEPKGTGCGYDSDRIWSSSACSGGHYTQPGSSANLGSIPVQCTSDTSTAYVRCCADTTASSNWKKGDNTVVKFKWDPLSAFTSPQNNDISLYCDDGPNVTGWGNYDINFDVYACPSNDTTGDTYCPHNQYCTGLSATGCSDDLSQGTACSRNNQCTSGDSSLTCKTDQDGSGNYCECTNTTSCEDDGTCYSETSCRDYNSADDIEYCSSGSWIEQDSSSAGCTACTGSSRWSIGGEVAGTTCCGDDTGEYRNLENSHSGTLAFDNNEDACCNVASDCVSGTSCYNTEGASVNTDCGLNGGGNDDCAHCYNSSGTGNWLECDVSDWMDYWCGDICGPQLGAKDPRTSGTPDDNWNAAYAGEAGVGEYPDTSTLGCCGDDSPGDGGENYMYFQDYGGVTCNNSSSEACINGGDDSLDDACCNDDDDCVFNKTCYTENSFVDITGDGRIDGWCMTGDSYKGHWRDCDDHEDNCNGSCGATWMTGGEANPFGEYETGSETECCGDDQWEAVRSKVCDNSYACTSDSGDQACCIDTGIDSCVDAATCHNSGMHNHDANSNGDTDYCLSGTWYDCYDNSDCDPTGEYAYTETSQPCSGPSECTEACTSNDCIYKRYDGWNDCDNNAGCVSNRCVQDTNYATTFLGAGMCDNNVGAICTGGANDNYDKCVTTGVCLIDHDHDDAMADCDGDTCLRSDGETFDLDNDGDLDYCNNGIWLDCTSDSHCPAGSYCSSNNCASLSTPTLDDIVISSLMLNSQRGELEISWIGSLPSGYEYRLDEITPTAQQIYYGTNTSYLHEDLDDSTEYCYKVRIQDDESSPTHYSEWSSSDCETTHDRTGPTPSPTLTLTPQSASNRIDLSWTDPSGEADNYSFYRAASATSQYQLIQSALPGMTYQDTGATDNTAPGQPSGFSSSSHTPGIWSNNANIVVNWTTDASDVGDDYYYYLNAFDTPGNESNLVPDWINYENGWNTSYYPQYIVSQSVSNGVINRVVNDTGVGDPRLIVNDVITFDTTSKYILIFDMERISGNKPDRILLRGSIVDDTQYNERTISTFENETKVDLGDGYYRYFVPIHETDFTGSGSIGGFGWYGDWAGSWTAEYNIRNVMLYKVEYDTITTGLDGYDTEWSYFGEEDITTTLKDMEEGVKTASIDLIAARDGYYFNLKSVDNEGNWADDTDTYHYGPFRICNIYGNPEEGVVDDDGDGLDLSDPDENCYCSDDNAEDGRACDTNVDGTADTMCVFKNNSSFVCDPSDEICLSTQYYENDCQYCSETETCDSDGGASYSADGVCLADTNNCCTSWSSGPSGNPDQCDTETAVCDDDNTDYCDDVSDASWDAGDTAGTNKYRCDQSDQKCRLCTSSNTESDHPSSSGADGTCESGCGAASQCDEQTSDSCADLASETTSWTQSTVADEKCGASCGYSACDSYCCDAASATATVEGTESCTADKCRGTCSSSNCLVQIENGYMDCDSNVVCVSNSCFQDGSSAAPGACDTSLGETCDGDAGADMCVPSGSCAKDTNYNGSYDLGQYEANGSVAFDMDNDGDNDFCDTGIWKDCSTDSECQANSSCSAEGDCLKSNGETCSSGDECASGNCIDEVCCDTACDGTCEACDISGSEGACSPIASGTDPDNECPEQDCSDLLYGWGTTETTSCKVKSATTPGMCSGSASCRTLSAECSAQNIENGQSGTAICGSEGCRIDCPTDGTASNYDTIAEVCYTSGQHSCSAGQVCDSTGTCNNVPTVTNVVVNSNQNINLTAGGTVPISWTATVTDADGYDKITTVTGKLYRSGVTGEEACTPDNNNCYEDVDCSLTDCSGSSCTATCTADIYFHAEPTDTGTWSAEYWRGWVEAEDDKGDSGEAYSATGSPELNSLASHSIQSPVSFGELQAGQNTGLINEATLITNLGNITIDIQLIGNHLCTDYPTCSEYTIDVGYIEVSTSTFTYGTGTDLSTSATTFQINLTKPTTSPSNSTTSMYWGMGLPAVVEVGDYTSIHTSLAVSDE